MSGCKRLLKNRSEVRLLIILNFQSQCSFEMYQVLFHQITGSRRVALLEGIDNCLMFFHQAARYQSPAIHADDQ